MAGRGGPGSAFTVLAGAAGAGPSPRGTGPGSVIVFTSAGPSAAVACGAASLVRGAAAARGPPSCTLRGKSEAISRSGRRGVLGAALSGWRVWVVARGATVAAGEESRGRGAGWGAVIATEAGAPAAGAVLRAISPCNSPRRGAGRSAGRSRGLTSATAGATLILARLA